MLDKNESYDYQQFAKPLQQVVSIPNPLYKSLQGIYFIGQTPSLFVSNSSNAWAALVNPRDSCKDLFVNVLTISNFSTGIITAEIWLNTNPPGDLAISSSVSPANTALEPQPRQKVLLEYVQSTEGSPSGGVNIYDRIVPPNTTLASEEDGKLIIPPGGNFVLFLRGSSNEAIKTIVAFGWWEK
ncbi:hypothetical protein CLLI_20000 [Clostridium liquoris]|jgi:hypothetical protein|uniref:Uncharacterized protein n=1 Tax=Clostridium liquoris TaxID=1289519 RepID=A0A2T0B2F5_9CLOT|nr:DUF6143 family protein [Clostridium liquoris]PRR78080.1 hypothetical protein CLLI_20000 [Clostridium liquoris]